MQGDGEAEQNKPKGEFMAEYAHCSIPRVVTPSLPLMSITHHFTGMDPFIVRTGANEAKFGKCVRCWLLHNVSKSVF